MAFFQMDDKFHSELRVMQAGTAAFGLYSRCGDWVADHLMDGFVPAEVAANFGTREWIERLLDAGLWLPADGGFTMPDYLGRHGNWSKERVLAHRAAAAERQARARGRRTGRQDDDMSQRESRVTHNVSNGVSHSSPSHPIPSHGVPPTDSLRSSVPPEGPNDDAEHQAKPKAKRGTRIPDGFTLTDAMRDWGRENYPGVDGEKVTAEFIDYWRGVPGQRGVKVDWVATWRNAVRRAAERAPTSRNGNNHYPRPVDDLGGDAHIERFLARQAERRNPT